MRDGSELNNNERAGIEGEKNQRLSGAYRIESESATGEHTANGQDVDVSAATRQSGEIAAALLAVLLGISALTAAHWWSAADPASANPTLLRWGSWLPGGRRIGPFAGKETAGLVVWLGSWMILSVLLRRREMNIKQWAHLFLAGIFLLLVLLWPPVYHRLYGWPF